MRTTANMIQNCLLMHQTVFVVIVLHKLSEKHYFFFQLSQMSLISHSMSNPSIIYSEFCILNLQKTEENKILCFSSQPEIKS